MPDSADSESQTEKSVHTTLADVVEGAGQYGEVKIDDPTLVGVDVTDPESARVKLTIRGESHVR